MYQVRILRDSEEHANLFLDGYRVDNLPFPPRKSSGIIKYKSKEKYVRTKSSKMQKLYK